MYASTSSSLRTSSPGYTSFRLTSPNGPARAKGPRDGDAAHDRRNVLAAAQVVAPHLERHHRVGDAIEQRTTAFGLQLITWRVYPYLGCWTPFPRSSYALTPSGSGPMPGTNLSWTSGSSTTGRERRKAP